ncbi:MAG TPA: hypothetical protein VGC80_02795, partial [Acetobacteraceae bacterium]
MNYTPDFACSDEAGLDYAAFPCDTTCPPLPAPRVEATEDAVALVAGELDAEFYRAAAGDLGERSPAAHYHEHGWRQGLNPNIWFDTRYYLTQYPDIAAAGIDPFHHFLAHGRAEGRRPARPGAAQRDVLEAAIAPQDRRPGYDAPADAPRLSEEAVAGALSVSLGQAPAGLVLAASHDRYVDVTGGMQIMIADEQVLFNERGFAYLHISPAISRLTLGSPDEGSAWLQLVLQGRFLGLITDAALARVLRSLPPRGRRIFVVHSVFGHRPASLAELARSLAPAHSYFWLHDYSALCEGFNLLRDDVEFCHAPPVDSMACRVCIYGANRARYLLALGELFEGVEFHVLAPSRACLDIFLAGSSLPWLTARVHENATLLPDDF